MSDLLPVGTEVHCKYSVGDFEFDGRIVEIGKGGYYGRYLVEVTRGTGHQREESLHDGRGNSGDCWFVQTKDVQAFYPEYKYDPSQQGDREDDI